MNTIEYLEKVNQTPEKLAFNELMEVIENEYEFTPTSFKNGDLENNENENLGSCKIFSFAQLHSLTAEQALACFGAYYREDVLQNPEGNDHQNIRNFMSTGWDGIEFKQKALTVKNT